MNIDFFDEFVIDRPNKKTKIKLEENGKVYYGDNSTKKMHFTIQIDGGLIKSIEQKKCDKGLCVEEKNGKDKFYLIELKGADLSSACKQLISTLEYMKVSFPDYIYYCRAVVSRIPKAPKLYPTSFKRIKQIMGNRFDCGKSPYSDII